LLEDGELYEMDDEAESLAASAQAQLDQLLQLDAGFGKLFAEVEELIRGDHVQNAWESLGLDGWSDVNYFSLADAPPPPPKRSFFSRLFGR
jgi:hypothetical protein